MNEHGRLPKAERDQLSPELRERLSVWFDKAYQDDNLFLTLARRPAVLDLFLDWVRFVYTDASSLSPKMVELCRVRGGAEPVRPLKQRSVVDAEANRTRVQQAVETSKLANRTDRRRP
jgi:hypothetical protein